MISSHDPREVIRRLTLWADRNDSVRAMLLTSTRAIPDATVDVLSDYDAVLVVGDVRPFFEGRSWHGDFHHPAPRQNFEAPARKLLLPIDLTSLFRPLLRPHPRDLLWRQFQCTMHVLKRTLTNI